MSKAHLELTESLPQPHHTDIIDVRSPSEFQIDHIPHARNHPVLDDEERKQIGTLHKHDAFGARKAGAALISRNIASLLEGPLRQKDGSFYPYIYCWRGGQRSQSLAIILSQIGFRTTVLEGGYKRYRHHVLQTLENIGGSLKLRVLAGLTGTSKTRLLHRLQERGEQIIDLEGLANHKGSILGSPLSDKQPPQKLFESRLAATLENLDLDKEIWIECESNKIGSIHTPCALFQAMQQAPVIEVRAPLESRIQYLLKDYGYFCNEPQLLKHKIGFLSPYCSKARLSSWNSLIDQHNWGEFVGELLTHHYDPSYRQSQKRWAKRKSCTYTLENLEYDTLDRLVETLLKGAHSQYSSKGGHNQRASI